MAEVQQRLTVPKFTGMKAAGHKISMLTAYDFPTAALLDQAGIDAILVGDSMGMVVQGKESTVPVTLDEIIYHAALVGRAVRRALTIVDLPFPTCHLGVHDAVAAGARILKETGCQAVKLEGGADQASVVEGLVRAGIPVIAHCGLRPQSINVVGSYKVQRDEALLLNDARAAQQAGAFALLLECIPSPLAKRITAEVEIPTIGIGAGPHCDGQVLVTHDLLGLTSGYLPRFVKRYEDLAGRITAAVKKYQHEVRDGEFPDREHSYK